MTKQQIPVQKNDVIEVEFQDLTHQGSGVAKIDGYTLFVPSGLPGEKATVKVLKTKKAYGYGKLIEVKEASEERTTPPCPIFNQCGGCQLQHLTYEGQLHYKQNQVENALSRIGGLDNVNVHPIIGMDDPWRYRNKAQVPVGEGKDGLVAGFYQRGSHRIINMEACLIQEEANDHVISTVKSIADSLGIHAYDEKRNRGVLRHIIAKYGKQTNEVMVVIITRTKDLPHKKQLIEHITAHIPNVKSIVHNVNPKRTNVIFGDETNVIWGEPYIYDFIGDVKFAISARSFYQVNPVQTKILYDKALEYADLSGDETVIDAYCGIGTISLFLAKRARKVYGVEIIADAIADANRNATLNDIHNAEFVVGQAEKIIPKWHEQGIQADVIVIDPPRKGCDEALLNTLIAMKPKRIVYVSCNPATLARDLRTLEDGGFQTKEIQPVDMFPHTSHVEAIALIQRKFVAKE